MKVLSALLSISALVALVVIVAPVTFHEARFPAPELYTVTREDAREAYGSSPLAFEANVGQTDPQVDFLARAPGYHIFLSSEGAVLQLQTAQCGNLLHPAAGIVVRDEDSPCADAGAEFPDPDFENQQPRAATVRLQLIGADPGSRVSGIEPLPGRADYLIGEEPGEWQTDIPTFGRVQYLGIYPGVDLVYYGQQGQLEYDWIVAAQADPQAIRLQVQGAQRVEMDARGDLLLHTTAGTLRQLKPVVYQELDGGRQAVAAEYRLHDDGLVSFQLGAYDRSRPLVIDPLLVYEQQLTGSRREG